MGSEDYSIVPMIVSNFKAFGTDVEIEGLTFRTPLGTKNNWQYGLTYEVDTGRDDGVENQQIAQLEELDIAFNVGGFVATNYDNAWLQGDSLSSRLSIYSDASGVHEGQYATAELSYAFPMIVPWRVEFEIQTTYASAKYMNTYFGVNSQETLRSGLDTYRASSSLRDVSLNANIGFFTHPNWGAFLRLGATKLMGEAKDSPIIAVGSDSQYFVGFGLFYRLGE